MQSSSSVERTLHITGMAFVSSADDVANYLKKLGLAVEKVVFFTEQKDKRLKRAVVRFKTIKDMLVAIEAINFRVESGFILKAHPITDQGKHTDQSNNTVLFFPSSLDLRDVNERVIYNNLKKFGRILNISPVMWCYPKQCYMAFCQFADEESTQRALSYRWKCGIKMERKEVKSAQNKS